MKFREKLKEWNQNGVILSALDRFSSFIQKQLRESVVGKIFTSYEKEENAFKNGFFASLFRKDKKSKLLTKLKFSVARAFEKNTFLEFLSKCSDYFLGCRLKVYGLFTLSFGLYTALMYVFKKYAFYLENASIDHLYFGIGTLIVSLLLIPSGQTLADALLTSRIMRYILSDALGIRVENLVGKRAKKGGSSLFFFVGGILAGLSTYYLSPLYMLVVIFGLVSISMIFSYPEVGILLMIFVSPFIVFMPHPSLFLAGMVIVTTLSYLVKLIRGKRTFKLELIDFFVLLFALLVLFGGVVSFEISLSLKPALLFVCFMLGYFLVVNLMRTKLWLSRTILMFTSSALVVSVWGIWQYYTVATNENRIGHELFKGITERAVSTFENPNMLAEYLILVLPFIMAMYLYSKKDGAKLIYFVSLVSVMLCLIYTWSRGAWVGAIAALLLFFVFYSKKTLYVLMLILASLPLAAYIIPQTVLERFLSIGVGEGIFESLYPMYSYVGMEASTYSHSIYLQITLELGIVGIIIFFALVFLLFQGGFEYSVRSSDKRSKLMSSAALCSIFGALVQGGADYIWYNYRAFFLFWIIAGIACAYRRIGYEDEEEMCAQNDENTAQLDIKLSKRI